MTERRLDYVIVICRSLKLFGRCDSIFSISVPLVVITLDLTSSLDKRKKRFSIAMSSIYGDSRLNLPQFSAELDIRHAFTDRMFRGFELFLDKEELCDAVLVIPSPVEKR